MRGRTRKRPAANQPAGRFPQILKALRKERGLTQRELSDELGISYGSIIDYENGRTEPNARAIVAMEQYFGITAAALLGLEPASPAAIHTAAPDKPLALTDTEARLLEDFRQLSAAIHAAAADKPLALTETEARLLEDFRQLSAENQTTLLRLAAKFAAVDKAFTAWLDADEPC